MTPTVTATQFWNNAVVRAVLTAFGMGLLAFLAPLLPVFQSGLMPGQDALLAALMFGVGGFLSVIVSLLTRLTGDPNSGSFTH